MINLNMAFTHEKVPNSGSDSDSFYSKEQIQHHHHHSSKKKKKILTLILFPFVQQFKISERDTFFFLISQKKKK